MNVEVLTIDRAMHSKLNLCSKLLHQPAGVMGTMIELNCYIYIRSCTLMHGFPGVKFCVDQVDVAV